ncbi:MAG: von Willebrand factor type A domain-containing protein [Coriobacteriales bacterium]|nr:von Willebrand factor type A domain-containing protein [Coriobacteriales bacterium]
MLIKKTSVIIVCVTSALVLGLAACGLSPAPFDEGTQATKTDTAKTEVAPSKNVSVETEAYEVDDMTANSMVMGYDIPEFNTEEYDSVEESGFVSTVSSPLSTVSADVDTASYANLRRMLFNGYKLQTAEDKKRIEELKEEDPYWTDDYYSYEYNVIPTGAVRIEEMLNYFNYDYEVPDGQEGFAVTARVGACPWNKDTELLVLGFATPHESAEVKEKGSNLVFLIDVSGSMDNPDKLPLLQSAFAELVEDLDQNDRVSIVTYSGEEEVVLEGESGANHREIMRAIRGLDANGSTNGEAGLRMAYKIAEDNFIEGGVNRIVMASDGDLNVGMTSESDLHDFVDQKRQSGVYLSVLGFGAGNYKDNKMETLADHGNGSYHYIDCEAEAKRVFGERLTANLIPFANDVKVQVEFNPAAIKGYRLIGYENRTMAAEDFKNDEKDAGEVGPESQFTVAYEIVRTDSAMEISVPELKYGAEQTEQRDANELLTAKLRYKPISGDDVQEQERVVTQDDWSVNPGDDWRFAAAVTEFGMLLRDSEHKGSSSFDSVRELVGQPAEETRVEFLELVDKAQNN